MKDLLTVQTQTINDPKETLVRAKECHTLDRKIHDATHKHGAARTG